jgi:PAS domain S-box-containing protein
MGRAHRHVILALAILLGCCRCAVALDPSLDISQYAHTAWRVSEGFIKGPIYSIAQMTDAYLWLGTEAGLARFDGVRTVPWQPPGDRRLPAGRIRQLLVTRDGTLWIGTDGGLGSLKNGQLTHYPELAGHIIFALLEDRDGTVWAGGTGVSNGILCGIHNGSVHCYGDDGSFGQGVFALHEDGKGNLWARVADGLWKWKPGPPKFYSLPGDPPSTQALSEDADGTLLVGWNGGIYRFVDGKTEAYSPPGISRQFMSRTLRDRNGGLWIGTHESGLLHVHQGKTDVFSTSDGLSGEVILGILEDREGNIWVGTNGGLDRFRDSAAVTFNVKQGLSNAAVATALADKDGSVWLATIGGLNRWDHGQIMIPPTGTAKRDGKLNGNNPTSLFQDDRGRIWVSTFREFGYLENARFTTIKGIPEGNKPSIAQDTAGNVWVIDSYVGLFQISPQNEVREIPWADLGHKDDASVLAADRRQSGLWIGFSQGGIAYFSDGQVRATYTTTDGLGAGRVRDLQFGDDGALWVSTERGLSQLKNNRIATMTSKNGLPCDGIQWAMEEDDRSLWLYMACGLVRIARSELDAWVADPNRTIQATVFDSSDGVRSTLLIGVFHPQVARTRDGRLWFLPGDGVSVIDTLHVPRNELPPPVHVEQIIADRKIYDASSDANGRLRLPPLIRDLEIDYTALSLAAPEKVRFRVKLEGWDRDWKDAGNERKAFYGNLPPRNYRFRVIACNNSGVWNEAGDTLDFSIDPAYWQTNWFRVSCVAALAILLWMIYKLRVRSIQLHSNQLALINSKLETQIAENADLYSDLQRSETYLAQGQSISHTGSFGRGVLSGKIYWSEETYKIFEHDRSVKPTLESVLERIHPDDRDYVQQTIDRATHQRTDFDIEYRLLRPDGSVKYLHVLARALESPSGDLEYVGAVTDITAAKQAEDKIRQSEMELRQILDFTPQLVAVMGLDNTRLYANQAVLDYYGLTHEEWRSRDPGSFVHPEDRERFRNETQRKFLSGLPHETEIRSLGKDGTYRWFLYRWNPLRDEQGRLIRWYLAATDIEVRKQAEQRLQNENVALREEIDRASMFEEIVGISPALRAVLSCVSKVAPTDSTVLITGETGTGKELIARAVHKRSQRSSKAFVSVNCAAVPRDLIASELFGHEKGAFTGALQRRLGRFELAEGGTIFLDEIGELPAETQIALLRVLQEREFERVGGTVSIRTNVRVIAATNRDLQAAIAGNTFRSDLFYRLNVFPIEMPPLRERREDIPLLVEYFIDRYARKAGKRILGINKNSLELLQSYPWPGNIRELQNVIERSVIVCETENFSVDASWLSRRSTATGPSVELGLSKKLPSSEEKAIIEAALTECHGQVSGPSGAAAKLGIPGSTLESKIKSLKIDKNRFKSAYISTTGN